MQAIHYKAERDEAMESLADTRKLLEAESRDAVKIAEKLIEAERKLDEARAEAAKWERLHDDDTATLVLHQTRDNYGPTETLDATALRILRERDELRELLRELIRNFRDVKGRHHSQIAAEEIIKLIP